MRPTRGTRGTSLVEVVVATLMVSTAVLAAAASVLESAEHQRANARLRAVTPVVATLLDEARDAAFDQLETLYSGATRDVVVPNTEDAVATFAVANVDTTSTRWLVKRVTVTVSWTNGSNTSTLTGVTYVCDRSGEILPETN